MRFMSVVLATTAVLAGRGVAQVAPSEARLLMSDLIELPRLVDLCATRLSLNIEYDPAVIKGPVALRFATSISDDELWALTNRLLAARGFTTVRAAGEPRTVSVVKLGDAAQAARLEREEAPARGDAPPDSREVVAGFQSVLLTLTHAEPKPVMEAVRLLLSKPGGTIAEISTGPQSTSALLVSDLTPRLAQIRELVARLDVPADLSMSVLTVPIRNVPAASLATHVSQIAARQGVLATGGGASSAATPAGAVDVRGAAIMPSPSGSAVIVVAPAAAAPRLKAMIELLDEQEPLRTVTYSSEYFSAADVAKLIDDSEESFSGVSANAASRTRVVVDALTRSLLVTATAAGHQRVERLIDRLRQIPPAARRPTRAFRIINRPVSELLPLVERLLSQGALQSAPVDGPMTAGSPAPESETPKVLAGSTASPGKRDVARAEDAAARDAERAPGEPRAFDGAPELKLTADEVTNTLFAIGEPVLLTELAEALKALDVRQPQVVLEVLLLSLTDSQTLALGIELERLTRAGDANIRLSSLFGLSTRASDGGRAAGDSAGGTITVLSPGEFSIVIRAVETLNDGRSLSLPRILVGNNQSGEFNASLQQPVATTVTPSSQVTTTSFGGYEQAGTNISVTPRITQGDHLALRYNVTLSSFVGQGAGGLPPPRQENSLSSVVVIPDAFTVAVGGIELVTEGEQVTQVPILGSIPLVGELFKNRSNATTRTKFYVFIRAEILRARDFSDLRELSDRDRDHADLDPSDPRVEPLLIRGVPER